MHYFPEYCTSQLGVHLPNPEKRWQNRTGEEAVSLVSEDMVSKKNLWYATKTTESLKHFLYRTEETPQIILELDRVFYYTAFTRLHDFWCPDLRFFIKKAYKLNLISALIHKETKTTASVKLLSSK